MLWGLFLDKFGFKTSFTILTVGQAILQFIYPFCGNNKVAFCGATMASFFFLSGMFSMVPPATQRLFGAKNGAQIYSVLYTSFGVASVASMYLSKVNRSGRDSKSLAIS